MTRPILVTIVLLLVAGGIWVAYAFQRDIAAARAAVTEQSSFVETSFGALEYAVRGTGEPLLMIHGSGGGFDQGLGMAAKLTASFRLIAPSRFGYLGSSSPANLTVAMQADALDELLVELGENKVIIAGGSAGALSAMELAIRHPERCKALVLLVPAAYAPTRKPNTSAAEGPLAQALIRTMLNSDIVFWAMLRTFPNTMTRLLLATDPALVKNASETEKARVAAIRSHILPIKERAPGLMFDMKTAGAPAPQAVEKITCPILTISLEDDLYGTAPPARYIAAAARNGRAVIYPTGGHIWVGHDDDIWNEIRSFLAQVDDSAVAAANT